MQRSCCAIILLDEDSQVHDWNNTADAEETIFGIYASIFWYCHLVGPNSVEGRQHYLSENSDVLQIYSGIHAPVFSTF